MKNHYLYLIALYLIFSNQLMSQEHQSLKKKFIALVDHHDTSHHEVLEDKNIISTSPLHYTQGALNIAYEHILGKTHGLRAHYFYLPNESENEINVGYRYYFHISDRKNFNLGNLHLKEFHAEHYTGLSFRYVSDGLVNLKALRIPIGTRLQFQNGINSSLTFLGGLAQQDNGISTSIDFSFSLILAVGYRF